MSLLAVKDIRAIKTTITVSAFQKAISIHELVFICLLLTGIRIGKPWWWFAALLRFGSQSLGQLLLPSLFVVAQTC